MAQHLTEGARLFDARLTAGRRRLVLRVARALAVSDTTIANWRSGLRRPWPIYREIIARIFPEIEASSWHSATEAAQIENAVALFESEGA